MSTDARSLTPLTEADYEAIEAAVMETSRGRWFLREFAARNRTADTNILLGAIERLEKAVSGEKAMEQVERVRFDLEEMSRSITQLKAEVDATKADGPARSRFAEASATIDGIAKATQGATTSIIASTEAAQELAWTLREQGVDEDACDRLDKLATEIYAACAFQDVAARRTEKVVRTLRFLEARINALMDAWAEPGQARPRRSDDSVLSFAGASSNPQDVEIVVEGESDPPLSELSAEEPMVIDDVDDDIGFEELPETLAELPSAPVARVARTPELADEPAHRVAGSLAELDAMPAIQKALIFG